MPERIESGRTSVGGQQDFAGEPKLRGNAVHCVVLLHGDLEAEDPAVVEQSHERQLARTVWLISSAQPCPQRAVYLHSTVSCRRTLISSTINGTGEQTPLQTHSSGWAMVSTAAGPLSWCFLRPRRQNACVRTSRLCCRGFGCRPC